MSSLPKLASAARHSCARKRPGSPIHSPSGLVLRTPCRSRILSESPTGSGKTLASASRASRAQPVRTPAPGPRPRPTRELAIQVAADIRSAREGQGLAWRSYTAAPRSSADREARDANPRREPGRLHDRWTAAPSRHAPDPRLTVRPDARHGFSAVRPDASRVRNRQRSRLGHFAVPRDLARAYTVRHDVRAEAPAERSAVRSTTLAPPRRGPSRPPGRAAPRRPRPRARVRATTHGCRQAGQKARAAAQHLSVSMHGTSRRARERALAVRVRTRLYAVATMSPPAASTSTNHARYQLRSAAGRTTRPPRRRTGRAGSAARASRSSAVPRGDAAVWLRASARRPFRRLRHVRLDPACRAPTQTVNVSATP